MVRKMAYLSKMDHADQLDNICRNHPRFMSYKLSQNYCVDCDEYQQGKKCRELGCRGKQGFCIPKDNTLGSFDQSPRQFDFENSSEGNLFLF